MKKSTKGLLFNKIQVKTYGENTFDLSHDVKLSGKMGNLIPCMVLEVVPGDKINLSQESLVRFAPLISPVMHRIDVSIHNFFVPNRILWPEQAASGDEGWENFITGQGSGGYPYLVISDTLTADQKTFLDYMGIPPIASGGTATQINALPIAAYQKIYNEYYRDQNLITAEVDTLVDGDNVANITNLLEMRKRAWEHDYFTSALPSAAFGADVEIPLGTITLDPAWAATTDAVFRKADMTLGVFGAVENVPASPGIGVSGNAGLFAYDPDGSLVNSPTAIKDLRRAFKIQEWLELLGRSGKRYIEFLKAFFNVDSKDKRLQRPEYINGSKTPVVISEVLGTAGTFDSADPGLPASGPVGQLAGHAIAVGNGNNGSYFVEEHGYIISILSIIPRTAYMQGIPRTYLKTDNYDYYFNQFAHIGEQEIQNRELYAYTVTGASTFGYIPRYAEYKYMPNRVAGDFRDSLLYWTMGRKFGALPGLSADFIEVDPDEDALTRIFAVEDGTDYLYMHILHKIYARRQMPVFGNPQL